MNRLRPMAPQKPVHSLRDLDRRPIDWDATSARLAIALVWLMTIGMAWGFGWSNRAGLAVRDYNDAEQLRLTLEACIETLDYATSVASQVDAELHARRDEFGVPVEADR